MIPPDMILLGPEFARRVNAAIDEHAARAAARQAARPAAPAETRRTRVLAALRAVLGLRPTRAAA